MKRAPTGHPRVSLFGNANEMKGDGSGSKCARFSSHKTYLPLARASQSYRQHNFDFAILLDLYVNKYRLRRNRLPVDRDLRMRSRTRGGFAVFRILGER